MSQTVSLVRKPASSRPWMGGTAGRLPVHSRMNRDRSSPTPSTSTVFGPVSRAAPKCRSSPASVKRSGLSSVSARSCWIERMRSNTRAVSICGSTGVSPYLSAWRMVCAAFAEASSALLGTHPVHRQSPPTRPRSTAATLMSRFDANSAATMPPEPMPTITRS